MSGRAQLPRRWPTTCRESGRKIYTALPNVNTLRRRGADFSAARGPAPRAGTSDLRVVSILCGFLATRTGLLHTETEHADPSNFDRGAVCRTTRRDRTTPASVAISARERQPARGPGTIAPYALYVLIGSPAKRHLIPSFQMVKGTALLSAPIREPARPKASMPRVLSPARHAPDSVTAKPTGDHP
jgi:hypothetical protein